MKKWSIIASKSGPWLVLLLDLVIITVLTATLFLPWYHVAVESTSLGTLSVSSLDTYHPVHDNQFLLFGWTRLDDSTEYHVRYTEAGRWGPVGELLGRLTEIAILAIVLGVTEIPFLLLKRFASAFALGLAMTVALAFAATMFYFGMTNAVQDSSGAYMDAGVLPEQIRGFAGSAIDPVHKMLTWGPMSGWWLLILSIVLNCLATYTAGLVAGLGRSERTPVRMDGRNP